MPETTQELGPLPPYLYGRECSENERVWSEEAVRAYALQERAAERERCARIVERVNGWIGTREVAAEIRGEST